jgi:acetamidase/formamidase
VEISLHPLFGSMGVVPEGTGRISSGPRWIHAGNMDNDFLATEKHLSRDDAYALTSVAVDVDITRLVNGKVGFHAMCPKSVFEP